DRDVDGLSRHGSALPLLGPVPLFDQGLLLTLGECPVVGWGDAQVDDHLRHLPQPRLPQLFARVFFEGVDGAASSKGASAASSCSSAASIPRTAWASSKVSCWASFQE